MSTNNVTGDSHKGLHPLVSRGLNPVCQPNIANLCEEEAEVSQLDKKSDMVSKIIDKLGLRMFMLGITITYVMFFNGPLTATAIDETLKWALEDTPQEWLHILIRWVASVITTVIWVYLMVLVYRLGKKVDRLKQAAKIESQDASKVELGLVAPDIMPKTPGTQGQYGLVSDLREMLFGDPGHEVMKQIARTNSSVERSKSSNQQPAHYTEHLAQNKKTDGAHLVDFDVESQVSDTESEHSHKSHRRRRPMLTKSQVISIYSHLSASAPQSRHGGYRPY